jgi:phage shock protein E
MKRIFRTYRKSIIASLLGAVAGYLYYAFVGCTSGGCMISSNPFVSTLYGAMMGLVAVGWPETKKVNTSTNNE